MHDLEHLEIASAEDLRAWLTEHHGQDDGIWCVTWKKSHPDRYVSTDEILDEILAFGWIDGRRMKVDESRTKQLLTPRRAQHWSGTYKQRAARLIAEGRMHPSGLASIERSKAAGLWDFLDDVDALIVPDDLQEAFARHPPAAERFASMGPATQRFALRWIKLAKTAPTRAKRVEETAARASRGEKVPGA